MHRFLQTTAWSFLLDQKIASLPVDPFRIATQNGWKIYTYEAFAAVVGKSVAELIARYEKDGFAFCAKGDDTFVICYNSALPFSTCRWTLLHEIAHIHLGHINPQTPIISRVRTEYRPLLEQEAQGFARRVLCPSIVLHHCKAHEPDQIMRLCGVSRDAANYRSKYLKKLETRGMFGVHPLERKVEAQFAPFVRRYLLREAKIRSCNFWRRSIA